MEEVMSRDHYKGIPKKRAALLDSSGNVEALEKGGDVKRITGTATLTAGTVTVTDSRFVATAFALVSTKHPYPADEGINWYVGDGYLTVSGSNADTYTVGYEVVLP
jgi:hypothetical protein